MMDDSSMCNRSPTVEAAQAKHPSDASIVRDPRSLLPVSSILYKNLHKFRVTQMNEGVDLRELTDEQWGLAPLDKCHHISTTCTARDGPQSFRVRICKTCCQEDSHIELGTYVDQESAVLVNDSFEILNNRFERLIVLRREDRPFLQYLLAKKYDRSKGRDYSLILDLIAERVQSIEEKKLKSSSFEGAEAGVSGAEGASLDDSVATDGKPTPTRKTQVTRSCTSSEASEEAWSLSGGPSNRNQIAVAVKAAVLNQAALGDSSHSTSSNENASSDCAEESEEEIDNSSPVGIRYDEQPRKFSKSLAASGSAQVAIDDSASYGRVTAEGAVGERVEKYSTSNTSSLTPRKRSATFSDSGSYYSSYLSDFQQKAKNYLDSKGMHYYGASSNELTGINGIGNLKRIDSVSELEKAADSPAPVPSKPAQFSSQNLTSKAAMTSKADEAAGNSLGQHGQHYHNPIATLTWLASLEEEEVDVARSLFELRAAPASRFSQCSSPTQCSGVDARDNSYTSVLSPNSAAAATALASAAHMSVAAEDEDYNSDEDCDDNGDYNYGNCDDDGVDDDEDEDNQGDRDADDRGEDEDDDVTGAFYDRNPFADEDECSGRFMRTGRRRASKGRGNLKSAATAGSRRGRGRSFSTTDSNNSSSNVFNRRMREAHGRARSNSMPTGGAFDRNDVIWSVLGNIACYRAKGDPLSVALRKYYERGGMTGAGFIGIYSPEDRKNRIARFLEKRKRRMWTKKVKYDVRKNFADSRVRIKGRFVKKHEEMGNSNNNSSHGGEEADELTSPATSNATSAVYSPSTAARDSKAITALSEAAATEGDRISADVLNHSPFSNQGSSPAIDSAMVEVEDTDALEDEEVGSSDMQEEDVDAEDDELESSSTGGLAAAVDNATAATAAAGRLLPTPMEV